MSTKGQRNVEAIIENIEASIAAGEPRLPWNKPWALVGHKSVKTGHVYQGGNGMWTALLAEIRDYGPAWGTFKQLVGVTGKGAAAVPGVLRGLGGTLRGQSGIGLWRPVFKKETDPDTGKKVQRLVAFRDFVAFNVDQVTYDDRGESAASIVHRLGRIRLEAAKRALSATVVRDVRPMAEIEDALRPFEASLLGGFHHSATTDGACYWPTMDKVQIPNRERFESVEAYYSTRFHEDAHATGHADRLNRRSQRAADFREAYSYEELVAELAASYLRAEFGIDGGTEETQSATYVRGWVQRMRTMDDKTLYRAMGEAVKAAQWVLLGDPALRAKDEGNEAEEASTAPQEEVSVSQS